MRRTVMAVACAIVLFSACGDDDTTAADGQGPTTISAATAAESTSAPASSTAAATTTTARPTTTTARATTTTRRATTTTAAPPQPTLGGGYTDDDLAAALAVARWAQSDDGRVFFAWVDDTHSTAAELLGADGSLGTTTGCIAARDHFNAFHDDVDHAIAAMPDTPTRQTMGRASLRWDDALNACVDGDLERAGELATEGATAIAEFSDRMERFLAVLDAATSTSG